METPAIVLAPDIFDALAASCERWGGIGACFTWADEANEVPLCLMGHAWAASWPGAPDVSYDTDANERHLETYNRVLWAFRGPSRVVAQDNDEAVIALAGNSAALARARVSWEAYCMQRHIVRGSAA